MASAGSGFVPQQNGNRESGARGWLFGRASGGGGASGGSGGGCGGSAPPPPYTVLPMGDHAEESNRGYIDDDEAYARRLQEEFER